MKFLKLQNILLLFLVLNTNSLVYASGDGKDMPDLARLAMHDGCSGHDCAEQRALVMPGGGGSSGKWLDSITPKNSWTCREIEDYDDNKITCEMCEREEIRYVHTMHHRTHSPLKVGCICAGHMEGNIEKAKEREKYFHSRIGKRERFVTHRSWRISAKNNSYINYENHAGKDCNVVIVKTTKSPIRYSANIDGVNIRSWHNSEGEAKLAAFDIMWPIKCSQP
jgi:hypothetical protein